MSAVTKPQPVSAGILLRQTQPCGIEVFLVRKPSEGSAMNGGYRFPATALQKSDYGAGILSRLRGLGDDKARKLLGAHLAPSQAMGFWVAAIRALFEQTGILFAVKESSEPVTGDRELDTRLFAGRAALRDRALTFQSILEREKLYCDGASLAYFSHWQTTAEDGRGFDTRFFLAPMPDDPTPLATADQDAPGWWLAPDRALQLFNRGELPLAFPAFASLRVLADFDSVQSVLKEYPSQPG